MDSNAVMGKELLKKTSCSYFHGFPLTLLKELGFLVTGQNEKTFRARYQNLLPLLYDGYEH